MRALTLSRLAVAMSAPLALAVAIAVGAGRAGSAPATPMADARLDAPNGEAGPKPDAPGAKPDVADASDVARLDVHYDGHLPDVKSAPPRIIPPDPTPLEATHAFVLSVHWKHGTVTIDKAKRVALPKKQAIARKIGRFAAELYVGPTLVERLRFDFPLIGDDSTEGEAFAKGLDVTIDVSVPESDRPTRMEIWDRASDKRWTFLYPPKT